MKPLYLKMTAFGPYKDTEEIDFTELAAQQLFVIAGSTGAGKTTIFDALTYALYGEASGEDRKEDARNLRSDFAKGDEPSVVTLRFSIKERIFEVMRQLPYTKPGNKNETKARAELYEIVDGQLRQAVDRQIITEVNDKIEQLIGFTATQFKQLVMLPQGEFRKFLTSSTDEKEAMLRKIFQTERYEALIEVMKEEVKEGRRAYESSQRDLLMTASRVEKLAYPNEELKQLHEQSTLHVNHWTKLVANERRMYVEKLESGEGKVHELEKREQEVMKRLAEAEALNADFAKLAEQLKRDEQLKQERQTIEEQRVRLQRAEKARPLNEYRNQLNRLRAVAKEEQQRLKTLHVELERATEEESQASIRVKEWKAREDEFTHLHRAIVQMEERLPLFEKVEEMTQTKQKAKQQWTEATTIAERARKKLEQLTSEQKEKEKELKRARHEVRPYEKKLIERQAYEKQIELLEHLEKWGARAQSLEADYVTQRQTVQQLTRQVEKLEKEWLGNEAIRLRKHLVGGEPCPVCGSLDHFITEEEETSVDERVVQRERKLLQEAERTYYQYEQQYQHAVSEYNRYEAARAEREVRATLPQLREMFETTLAALDHIEKERQKVEQLEPKVEVLHKQVEEAEQAVRQAEERAHQSEGTYVEQRAILQQLKQSLGEEQRDIRAFTSELHRMQLNYDKMKKDRERAEEAWKKWSEQKSLAQERVIETEKRWQRLIEEGKEARAIFDEQLTLAEFQDEADYERALQDVPEIESLRKMIQQYETDCHMTTTLIAELKERLKGKEKVDETEWQRHVERVREQLKEMNAFVLLMRSSIALIDETVKEVEQRAEKLVALEKEVGELIQMYDLLRGQNHLKLSFERYIQIEYLERVIQAANVRFHQLSRGQYQFVRSEEQARHNRQSGLDLDIYDSYTGQARDVKTMSGGEKFLASLCLSLGMSDVIQSFQGAISVETLFIDEGFGSLDDESLRQAIDVLIDLQKSGRMIGVISHVEELKQAIPSRIEVNKTKDGHSELRVVTN